jgi:membrane protein DedA with SNARE-associated domain
MNLEVIFQQVFNLAGTFNPTLIVFLFLICSIGEFGASVPYLLETVWLLSGYNFAAGVLSFLDLVLLWLVAQVGRQIGGTMLYYLGRFGSMPLIKLYHKHFEASLSGKLSEKNAMPFNLFRRMNFLSPFSIALGRLFGLRIPLTLTLSVKKQLRTLLLGIVLSSLVWDGMYIFLGAVVGANVVLKPAQMILYSLIGLTILYAVSFAIRRLLKLRASKGGVREQV